MGPPHFHGALNARPGTGLAIRPIVGRGTEPLPAALSSAADTSITVA